MNKISFLRVLVNEGTLPKNDGTVGSALYNVVIELSAAPDQLWKEIFAEEWKTPPKYYFKVGLPKVCIYENKLHIFNTTIADVKDYHKEVLEMILPEVNKKYSIKKEALKKKTEEELNRKLAEEERIKNIAKSIEFKKS